MVLIIFAYVLLMVLVIGVAYVGIPADVRSMINENCRDSEGRLKRRYLVKEVKAVLAFYAQVLFAATLFAFLLLFALMVVHVYVVPLNLVADAVEVAELDPQGWKDNLASTQVKKKHTRFHVGRGGSWSGARDSMRSLWRAIPIAIMFSFIGLVLCLRLGSQGYNNAMSDLVTTETSRDRRRMTRRYLDSTLQARQRRRERRSVDPSKSIEK